MTSNKKRALEEESTPEEEVAEPPKKKTKLEEESTNESSDSDVEEPEGGRKWERVERWPKYCCTCDCPLFDVRVNSSNNTIERVKLEPGMYEPSKKCMGCEDSDEVEEQDGGGCECDDCVCGGCGSRKLPGKEHC